MKWVAIGLAILLVISCFYPWVTIESKNIVISGFHSEGTRFGKPGILHGLLSGFFVLFLLINRIWSVRTAFFIGAFNIAWAVRNFIVISTCQMGECPTKHGALYLLPVLAVLASAACLLMKDPGRKGSVVQTGVGPSEKE